MHYELLVSHGRPFRTSPGRRVFGGEVMSQTEDRLHGSHVEEPQGTRAMCFDTPDELCDFTILIISLSLGESCQGSLQYAACILERPSSVVILAMSSRSIAMAIANHNRSIEKI